MTDLRVANTKGSISVVDGAAVQRFRDGLRGELLGSDDRGYDAARRVWNGMIDKRPALIARCTGAVDVRRCVQFGREHELLVSVRGGGHNYAGKAVCDDGLMIDLSPMKASASIRCDRRPGRSLG
jgi:FAD/FMN-containing dehydrogenase